MIHSSTPRGASTRGVKDMLKAACHSADADTDFVKEGSSVTKKKVSTNITIMNKEEVKEDDEESLGDEYYYNDDEIERAISLGHFK